jgi:uncharacterized protein (TIGR03118 family)
MGLAMKASSRLAGLCGTVAAITITLAARPASAVNFTVTNLVSDGSVPAVTIDPDLVNPWGVSFGPTSPFWVSDNKTGVATLYNGAGGKIGLTVTIPPSPSAPTGQVFNSGGASAFQIAGTKPVFIFDSEDGVISGWAGNFGTTAQIGASTVGAVYKGLAIGSDAAGDHLYAADFHNGVVQEYTNNFAGSTTFTDTTVAAGYAPFNAQVLNGELYVTFAKQDATGHDDVAGAGNGYVDVFNLDGTFNRRLVSQGGEINSPWGLAIAPASFHELAGDLLVGNFGDGTISAFDNLTGAFKGKLLGIDNTPLVFGDLWALTPGNGAMGSSTQKIYFTAGLVEESEGLFGVLTVVPEPSSWALMIMGFGLMGAALRTRLRRPPQSALRHCSPR